MKGYLLDVNILIALLDSQHINHKKVSEWFLVKNKNGWATCPITENGFIRITSNPSYSPLQKITIEQASSALLQLISNFKSTHKFVSDTISLLDSKIFLTDLIQNSNQITDVYLAALAQKNNMFFATMDRKINTIALKDKNKKLIEVVL